MARSISKNIYNHFILMRSSRELCAKPLEQILSGIDPDCSYIWEDENFEPYENKYEDLYIKESLEDYRKEEHDCCLIVMKHAVEVRKTMPIPFGRAIYSEGDWASALLYVNGVFDPRRYGK